MLTSLRGIVLLSLATIIIGGVLIASTVINATSTPTPDLISPAAIAGATRSLPPYYVVQAGDTFDSIAARHRLTIAQLQQLNPSQNPSNLIAGQRLRLQPRRPGSGSTVRHAVRVVPAFWTVAHGDTLSSIAARTRIGVGDIAAFNPGVNPNLLKPGQRLKLKP